MRLNASCWSCTLLLVGHIGGVYGTVSDNKYKSGGSGKSNYERPSPWDQLFVQKKLDTECPVDHQLCPDSVGGGCCPKTKVCGTNACLAIVETAVVVSHPKITEAPPTPLFKRKLGSNKWDMIHEGIQGQKRDATECGADHRLCAASLNGGCCPNDRVCGTDSCYATSAAPASACGVAGYIACGIAQGGMFFFQLTGREMLMMIRWLLSSELCMSSRRLQSICWCYKHGDLRCQFVLMSSIGRVWVLRKWICLRSQCLLCNLSHHLHLDRDSYNYRRPKSSAHRHVNYYDSLNPHATHKRGQ